MLSHHCPTSLQLSSMQATRLGDNTTRTGSHMLLKVWEFSWLILNLSKPIYFHTFLESSKELSLFTKTSNGPDQIFVTDIFLPWWSFAFPSNTILSISPSISFIFFTPCKLFNLCFKFPFLLFAALTCQRYLAVMPHSTIFLKTQSFWISYRSGCINWTLDDFGAPSTW